MRDWKNGGPIIPEGQKVENAGSENAGPRQLSDSSVKLRQYNTDISVMNVTCREGAISCLLVNLSCY